MSGRDVDWSKLGDHKDTCFCRCETVWRSRAKYVLTLQKVIAETPCPSCGKDDNLYKVSSDPEIMEYR